MTWNTFHRRGEVLRTVLDHADVHRDGVLPMDLPGVSETFGDELTLIGALQLRWHTRLAGAIERELMGAPVELEAAVVNAWRKTAGQMAGVRAILDRYTVEPTSAEMAEVLERAHRKDWTLMAAMAGKASPSDAGAPRVGRRIEEKARAAYRPTARPQRQGGQHCGRHGGQYGGRHAGTHKPTLVERLKAHLVA